MMRKTNETNHTFMTETHNELKAKEKKNKSTHIIIHYNKIKCFPF